MDLLFPFPQPGLKATDPQRLSSKAGGSFSRVPADATLHPNPAPTCPAPWEATGGPGVQESPPARRAGVSIWQRSRCGRGAWVTAPQLCGPQSTGWLGWLDASDSNQLFGSEDDLPSSKPGRTLKISQEKERSVGVTLMLSGCGAPILCLPHTRARTRCVGEPQTKGVKWGPRLVPPAWEAFAPSGPF